MVQKKDLGFSRLVKITSKHHAILKRYRDDLLEFAQLRNAIVHNRVDTEYAIAEPHISVVEQIEWIEEEITKPQLVYPMFAKKVITFQKRDCLATLLQVMKENNLSKFPIYDGGKFQGVLSEKGIAIWLGHQVKLEKVQLQETTVGAVLAYQEKDTAAFIHQQASVYEAQELFTSQIGKGKRLDALIITKHAKTNEKLLGIITPRDIIDTVSNEW